MEFLSKYGIIEKMLRLLRVKNDKKERKKMKKTILITIILLFINVYAYGSTGYTNISDIPLYKNPSLDSEIKENLKMSSKVEILENNNEWCKVKTEKEISGWIEKIFLTVPSEKYVVNNTDYNINIRTSPTTGSKQVGQLLQNAKATYIDTYHSWHIIEYKGSEYYIASWLTDIEYKQSEKIYLLYDKINIRSSASLSSKVLAQGNKDDSFFVVGEENGWYKIRLKDKSYGYVAGWLITHDSIYKEEQKIYKKTTDSLNLRTGPSVEHKKIITLKNGETVRIIASENGWDKLITQN